MTNIYVHILKYIYIFKISLFRNDATKILVASLKYFYRHITDRQRYQNRQMKHARYESKVAHITLTKFVLP